MSPSRYRDGLFDITLYRVLEDVNETDLQFECILSIPGTDFQTSEKLLYEAGKFGYLLPTLPAIRKAITRY